MSTVNFTSNFMVSHRAGSTRANSIRQGFYAPEDGGSGDSARHTGQFGFDYSAINTTLNGMAIDSASLTMASTSWGVSAAYALNIYKSPFAANMSNPSKLSPDDYYPANDVYDLYPDYFETPEFSRSQTLTFSIPLSLLEHIRSGKLLACYRRTTVNTPTTSIHTREFTEPPVLTVVYHAPVSEFSLNKTTVDAGQTITATVTPSDSSYTHRVTWRLNGTYNSQYTISAGSTTNVFTVPFGSGSPATNNWCTAIPNATSTTCTCIVETLSGTTVMGSRSKVFTMTVPSSVKPTIASLSASIVSGYAGLYLKSRSKATLTANSPAGVFGSTIVSYSVGGGATNPYTTGVLSTVGDNTFYATVTDSRGRTSAAASISILVTDYSAPRVTSATVERASDTSGTLADEGQYAKCRISYTWTNLGSNTNSTQIQYRELGSTGSYTSSSHAISSGNFVVIGTGTTFDIVKAYEFKLTFSDGTGASDISFLTLFKGETFFDWHPGIDGACFGGFATRSNAFEISPNRSLWAYGQQIGTPANPNLLINPDFQVWQRGTSFTTSGYTADRWRSFTTGQTAERYETTAPIPTQYVMRLTRTSSTGYLALTQPIEGYEYMVGHPYTLSFWVKGTGGFTGTCWFLIGSTSFSITATAEWVKHSVSVSSFSYGSNGEYKGVAVSAMANSGTGIMLSGIKLEYGSIATPFSSRTYAQELAMCQRYYQSYTYRANGTYLVGTNNLYFLIPYLSMLRTTPTIAVSSSGLYDGGAGAISGITSYVATQLTNISMYMNVTKSAHGYTNTTAKLIWGDIVVAADAEIYP